jgi:hypothetical protein
MQLLYCAACIWPDDISNINQAHDHVIDTHIHLCVTRQWLVLTAATAAAAGGSVPAAAVLQQLLAYWAELCPMPLNPF